VLGRCNPNDFSCTSIIDLCSNGSKEAKSESDRALFHQ
jgi:hypothetical protein